MLKRIGRFTFGSLSPFFHNSRNLTPWWKPCLMVEWVLDPHWWHLAWWRFSITYDSGEYDA